MTQALFSHIEAAPVDPIFGVQEAFLADTNPRKVNLGLGVYCNEEGKIPVLQCVRNAEALWFQKEDTKTYLPIDGLKDYNARVLELVLGAESQAIKEKRAFAVQTVSGSGALRTAGDFIRRFFPQSEMWISDPTWENHRGIYEAAGFAVKTYPYYDAARHGVDVPRLLEALSKIPERSVVLLQDSCHNPTGCDLSRDEWREIVKITAARNLIPLLDMAYQGLDAGLAQDRSAVELLAESGQAFLVANSFSKNFSIYRERVGALTVVCQNQREVPAVLGQVKRVIRTMYSNPPSHGAQVVNLVLSTPELRTLWEKELGEIRLRLAEMRQLFVSKLKGARRDFSFVERQHGMFSYAGLTPDEVKALREKFGLHMLSTGRICIASLNKKNIDYVCEAIAAVV